MDHLPSARIIDGCITDYDRPCLRNVAINNEIMTNGPYFLF
jgi:hypothetical protein